MTNSSTPRRGFLGRAAAAVLGLAAVPTLAQAGASAAAPPDESWLQGLKGKHKQFFDVAASGQGRPLARVMNFLDAYIESYDVKDEDLNAIAGFHGSGLALVMNDALWAKYELGKRFNENDPATRAHSVRNPFAAGSPASVASLQKRGVRFIACLRSIRRLSGDLATERGGAAEQIRAELVANLLPGVTPVPAMIVAGNRAQESGLTYVYIG
jgi:intracellular sulfur oxidation DsrE/DsrF family protein